MNYEFIPQAKNQKIINNFHLLIYPSSTYISFSCPAPILPT